MREERAGLIPGVIGGVKSDCQKGSERKDCRPAGGADGGRSLSRRGNRGNLDPARARIAPGTELLAEGDSVAGDAETLGGGIAKVWELFPALA
jgi:hypothetical protein